MTSAHLAYTLSPMGKHAPLERLRQAWRTWRRRGCDPILELEGIAFARAVQTQFKLREPAIRANVVIAFQADNFEWLSWRSRKHWIKADFWRHIGTLPREPVQPSDDMLAQRIDANRLSCLLKLSEIEGLDNPEELEIVFQIWFDLIDSLQHLNPSVWKDAANNSADDILWYWDKNNIQKMMTSAINQMPEIIGRDIRIQEFARSRGIDYYWDQRPRTKTKS